MQYLIAEQADGRYVVTSEHGRTVIGEAEDCRSVENCYAALASEWLFGDMSREVTISFRFHREQLRCPECGEAVWDGPEGHKLAKCWNSEGHPSGMPLAFDTMDDDGEPL